MKKVLLVMSLISILFLAGCNKDEKNSNIDVEENANNQQQNTESISSNNQNKDVDESYKLSDKYELDRESTDNLFNVVLINPYSVDLIEDNQNEGVIKNPYRFESDGKEYTIECKRVNRSSYSNLPVFFDVTINGKEISHISDSNDLRGKIVGVGIIDLDKNDARKEIVIRTQAEMFINNRAYTINADDELEEIINISPRIVNDKCIFPLYLLDTSIVVGYYVYEDGELKFIDKLLTGENILNDDGKLPEEIRHQSVLGNATIKKDGKYLDVNNPGFFEYKVLGAKLKFNEEFNRYDLVYDIELKDDARWIKDSDPDFEEILPKGTIVSEVSISIIYQ